MKASHLSPFGEGTGLGSDSFRLKTHSRRSRWCAFVAAALVVASPAAVHGQCQYEVTLIHAPFCPGGWQPITSAEDMSENGVVVGHYEQCQSTTRDEAFMWSEQTGFVTLPRPAGIISAQALGVSDDGTLIVGQMTKQSGSPEPRNVAFIYLNGQMVNLGAQPGHHWSYAFDVSDFAVIAGQSQNVLVGPINAVKWVSQELEQLPVPSNDDWSGARKINNDNKIVGHIGQLGWDSLAAAWEQSYQILNPGTKVSSSSAKCLNDSDDIGGAINIPDGAPSSDPSSPIVWKNGTPKLLPIFDGSQLGVVNDVSDAGVAIGVCTGDFDGAPIWIQGVPVDLNSLIDDIRVVRISSATAIDSSGRILVFVNAFISGVNGVVSAVLTPQDSAPSDLNHDCATDVGDLFLLLSEWNHSDSFADINNSGNVDVSDLFLLLAGWG